MEVNLQSMLPGKAGNQALFIAGMKEALNKWCDLEDLADEEEAELIWNQFHAECEQAITQAPKRRDRIKAMGMAKVCLFLQEAYALPYPDSKHAHFDLRDQVQDWYINTSENKVKRLD